MAQDDGAVSGVSQKVFGISVHPLKWVPSELYGGLHWWSSFVRRGGWLFSQQVWAIPLSRGPSFSNIGSDTPHAVLKRIGHKVW